MKNASRFALELPAMCTSQPIFSASTTRYVYTFIDYQG